ncbi:thioredoxin-like protein [Melanogaster broomeanus]|nr:thioredoxin-like protein [Melanogaster broomeanus]
MKIFQSLSQLPSPLSIIAATLALQAAAAPVASKVLTPQNFKETIAEGLWFVEHFSPYCGHCRHFESTWNELVGHFESKADPGVHFAQVDCTVNGDLCTENGVSGYPQMNLYRNGGFLETYHADRAYDLLVNYLAAHAEPKGIPAPAIDSIEEEALPTPVDHLVVQTPRAEANPSGEVVSLDVQTFDSFLSQGPAFIKFFAPWCGHCKKLAPTWTRLARHMQRKMNIAEVNCDENKALCTSQGVTAFPILFYYAHDAKTDYSGGRSYDQLVAFTERASNPTMKVIEAPELEQVVRDNSVLYLLLHNPSDSQVVDDVAKESQLLFGSPPVYVSTSSELFAKHNIPSTSSSALLVFKDNDTKDPVTVFYPSSQPPDALKTWLFDNRLPTSLELTRDAFQQVMNAPHKPLVVIVSTPNGMHDSVAEQVNDIGKKWRLRTSQGRGANRDVVFTWMDADQWGKWMKSMYGIQAGTEPEVVVADHGRLVYYDKDGTGKPIQLTSTGVTSALEAIFSGTARAKHSENFLERTVRYFNSVLVGLEGSIAAHPYMTVLVIAAFVAAIFMAIRRLLSDDVPDWQTEQRSAKGGRLD